MRDIYVLELSRADLNSFFTAVQGWGCKTAYFENGEQSSLPASFNDAYAMSADKSVLLRFELRSMALHWHFFSDDELELDLDPGEVCGQADLDELVDFLRRLARQFGKPALLSPENDPATPLFICHPD